MFFGAATFGLIESYFFAETLLVKFVGTKADLLAEMTFSLVW
ncbi:Whole genome shotgun sequence [Vibrio parahaemolyticus]